MHFICSNGQSTLSNQEVGVHPPFALYLCEIQVTLGSSKFEVVKL